MAVTKIKPIKSTLSKALDYIQNPDKTDGKMLVSSFGCSYETADIEFGFTLAQAIDKGNNLAHHLIQSFEPGEVDYEKAHEIGKQLADAVTKGQYEYVLTTHIDKGHIHNHIIFCAVNFVDYHKYNSNKRSYYGIRNMSDKLCRENGLSVVVPGKVLFRVLAGAVADLSPVRQHERIPLRVQLCPIRDVQPLPAQGQLLVPVVRHVIHAAASSSLTEPCRL